MADVLIVCVREDEPQAKALADMFEAAGFSVGGAPSNDGALRSSGAGVIVWSRSSIRSRPFLDASQRVINAGKGVIASLIDPPPPESVGDSATFDLSAWNGDAEDPQLDPLFFAVDRMVNTARAAVGAAAPSAPVFEPPPSLRPPPPAPRPAPPRSMPSAAPAMPNLFQNRSARDGLTSEAEHWRAIRDSKNPADFMDYIARYGAEGAFTEVAELRLNQLTTSGATSPGAAATLRNAARAAAAEPARPQARAYDPPPRRMEPPPTRRPDPPPVARRPEPAPRRELPFERGIDRPPPHADLGRAEGGGMRALLLILLLGGAAVAGGLYLGQDQAQAPSEQADTAQPTDDLAAGEPADADPSGGISISEAADAPPARARPERRQAETPTRQQQQQQATREPPRTPTRAPAEEDGPTPAPVTSWAGGTGGPVSLNPTEQASNAPAAVAQLPPPLPTQVASVEPRTQTQLAPPAVIWTTRPSIGRITELYPARALRLGTVGRAVLECTVLPSLGASCVIASETPSGEGFGRAALIASGAYRARPTLTDGSSAVGARARIAIRFQTTE